MLAILGASFDASEAEFRLEGIRVGSGSADVQFVSEAGYYYILQVSDAITDLPYVANLTLGDGLVHFLSDTNLGTSSHFYRVERVPVLTPRDSDGDGIDDVWELLHRNPGAALDSLDVDEDHNGNGQPDRLDYLREKLRQGSARSRPAFAAGSHTLMLKTDGSLWACGENYQGELGIGTFALSETNAPVRAGNETNWVAVAASGRGSLALARDGSLWAWGENFDGRSGTGTLTNINTPTQVGSDTDWVAVSPLAGGSTLALKSDRSLWSLDSGTNKTPGRIGTDSDWEAISRGGVLALGIRSDGSLWSVRGVPTRIGSQTNWAAIAAGGSHALAIQSDGTLWAWGGQFDANLEGQLGIPGNPTVPTQVGTQSDWIAISAGVYHSLGLKSDGSLWVWGSNRYGQLGLEGLALTNIPTQLGTNRDWLAITAGDQHTIALRVDGTLVSWGQNSYGQLGIGKIGFLTQPTQVGTETNWVFATAGRYHSLAIQADGTLWSWGRNLDGQLGTGAFANQFIPNRVGEDSWLRTSGGGAHTVAIKSDGSLWAWGRNLGERLGSTHLITNWPSPVQLGTENDWSTISAGFEHSLALKTDGTLWSWGRNVAGELGNGTFYESNSPTRIGTNVWIDVAAGYYDSMAIAANNIMWAGGRNDHRELALDPQYSPLPPYLFFMRVLGTSWARVSNAKVNFSFYPHTLALKLDGTLWSWGGNGYGQLGIGTTASATQPIRVGSDTNWLGIAAGQNHSVGLKADGSIWAWGNGYVGQLGIGTRTNAYAPVRVGTSADWRNIAAGDSFTLAIKTDGTLWAWGDNTFGEIAQPAVWVPATVIGTDWGTPVR